MGTFLHQTFSLGYLFLHHFRAQLAIPEIRCTPPKEDMGIPKILTTFFIGKSQKIKHFFGGKGKEDMGIPNFLLFLT